MGSRRRQYTQPPPPPHTPLSGIQSPPLYLKARHTAQPVPLQETSSQNGILTPSQLPITIPSSAERPAGALTPSARRSVTAPGGELNPAKPAGEKIIFKTSKKTGKRVSKKILIKWSKGLELNIAKIIAVKKREYLSAFLNNAFCKNIKKDLKRKLNFKLSNLHKTVFSSKNSISLNNKQKILSS